jgi:tRNA (guanine37-N1)-methyltransferase
MRFDIISIFPEFFGSASPASGILGHGILKRGMLAGLVDVQVHDLRAHAHDKHRSVDDRPFGGGEGMVLKPEPLVEAVESLGLAPKGARDQQQVVLLSAQGGRFTQAIARELSSLERVVLLCGRYEGVDERVAELVVDRELSIGDYVLSGGELAAAVVVDAVARLVPGVLGNGASSEFESFGPADALMPARAEGAPPSATHGAGGLLDYPHYTRPAEFRGLSVPDVLTNGNHEQVRRWRREQALLKTQRNRPDLIGAAEAAGLLDRADIEFLARLSNFNS